MYPALIRGNNNIYYILKCSPITMFVIAKYKDKNVLICSKGPSVDSYLCIIVFKFMNLDFPNLEYFHSVFTFLI